MARLLQAMRGGSPSAGQIAISSLVLRARCEYSTATSSSEADKNASPVASTEHRNLTQEERKARYRYFFS